MDNEVLFAGIEEKTGVLQSTNLFLFPHAETTLRQIDQKRKNDSAYGSLSKYSGEYTVRTYSAGTMQGCACVDNLGLFLTLIFSQAPTTTGTAPQYTHKWTKLNTTTGTSASFYRKAINQQKAFAGVKVAPFHLMLQTNSPIQYHATLLGLNQPTDSTQAPPTSNADINSLFKAKRITIKLAEDGTSIANAPEFNFTTCRFSYNANLKGYPVLGQTGYGAILLSDWNVTIELKMPFQETTYNDFWFSDKVRYLKIEAISETINNITPKLTLNVPRVQVLNCSETKIVEHVEQTVTLVGQPIDEATTFTAELINGIVGSHYGG